MEIKEGHKYLVNRARYPGGEIYELEILQIAETATKIYISFGERVVWIEHEKLRTSYIFLEDLTEKQKLRNENANSKGRSLLFD